MEQLCQAVQGCALTPFNMGHNDRGERYDSLGLILRDSDHIDRFINNFHSPPNLKTKSDLQSKAMQSNIDELIEEMSEEERTIEVTEYEID